MWSMVVLIFLPLSTGFAHSRYTADYDLWLQSVPRRPVDLVTDVINDLGVRILQQYVGHGNVALSPTGAGFVLAALYEGSAGTGGRQIADALGLPRDRDVTRIGFRDIHRRLRTYLNADGFLGGLTLNRENTRLRPEYEDTLRFYGFNFEDLDADAEKNDTTPNSIPPAVAADANLATAPTTSASTVRGQNQETTPESVSETTPVATIASTAPSEVATSPGPDAPGATNAETEAATIGATEAAGGSDATGATNAETEAATIGATEAAGGSDATGATSAETVPATTAVPDTATVAVTEAATTAVTDAAENPETTVSNTGAATDPSNATPARLRESTTSMEAAVQETTAKVPSSPEPSTPEASVTEISIPTTSSSASPEPASSELATSSTDAAAAVTELDSGTTSATEVTPESGTETAEDVRTGSSEITMTTTDDKVLEKSRSTTEPSDSDSSSTETSIAASEESTVTSGTETGITVPPETTEAVKGSGNRMRRRYTRSPRGYFSSFPEEGIWMQDLGIWRVHSADSSGEANGRDSTELSFLVNGCDVAVVTASSYTAVLPFAYFPSLRAVALEFPLDDPRYNILLFLPTDRVNTRRLTRDLGNESLRLLRKQLQSTWVRATIPSFMLRGFVTLTPFLQRMGIRDVFEPRTADLSPMTPDLGVYARDVQQSIGVNIRNYMKPDRTNSRESDQFEPPMIAPPRRDSYRFHRPGNGLFERAGPVSFTAQHPFLYFIIDSETSVTLIAGRVDDPLNSRIL